METEQINKTCAFCEADAQGVIKSRHNTYQLELCPRCAKDILWELVHADYVFNEED